MVTVPAQRRAKLTSFPQCLTIPPRYHGDVEPSPIGWMLGIINMTNWEVDLDALVEATTAFMKSVRVEPPMHHCRTEPDAAGKSEQLRARRDPTARRQLQGSSAALHPGAEGLRRVRMEADARVAKLGQKARHPH
jgi:hypothetical protein